jgi:hypothetical protein
MSVKRESPTRFDVAYPEFTHHSTQVLDGRSAADVAVAGEPGRLVQAAGIECLYSAVTNTKPSKEASLVNQSLVNAGLQLP